MLDSNIVEKIEEKITSFVKSTDTEDTKVFNIVDYIEELAENFTESFPSKFIVKNIEFTVGEMVIWTAKTPYILGQVIGLSDHNDRFPDCIHLNVNGDIKRYNSCSVQYICKISNNDIQNLLENKPYRIIKNNMIWEKQVQVEHGAVVPKEIANGYLDILYI